MTKPKTWQKFKDLFQRILGDSGVFAKSIWKKKKRDFRYHDKLLQNEVVHLAYLESILTEFNLNRALEEGPMIWSF